MEQDSVCGQRKALEGQEDKRSAVLINAVNPTKKVRSEGIINSEKGYEMDPIWSGFNEVFREMLNKKVPEK